MCWIKPKFQMHPCYWSNFLPQYFIANQEYFEADFRNAHIPTYIIKNEVKKMGGKRKLWKISQKNFQWAINKKFPNMVERKELNPPKLSWAPHMCAMWHECTCTHTDTDTHMQTHTQRHTQAHTMLVYKIIVCVETVFNSKRKVWIKLFSL